MNKVKQFGKQKQRISAIILCLAMLSCLCACGELPDNVENVPANTQQEKQSGNTEDKVIFRKDVGEWPGEEEETETSAENQTTHGASGSVDLDTLTESPQPTIGQRNALKSAKSYLDYTAFSYKGLIEQLEYEEYSHEDAVYAADNCGADWNEQAVKMAKQYLDYTAFSRNGLIGQLEYEGFTHEQAVYGVEANGY